MSLIVNIEDNLAQTNTMLTRRFMPITIKATKRTLSRAVKDAEPLLNKLVMKRVKIKKREIKTRRRTYKKLKGNRLWDLEAGIGLNDVPMEGIMFVKGRKTPEKQKGKKRAGAKSKYNPFSGGAVKASGQIRYPGRRRIKLEVKPGKVQTDGRLFIARVRAGKKFAGKYKNLLVRRIGGAPTKKGKPTGPWGSLKIKAESAMSLHFLYRKHRMQKTVERVIGKGMQSEFIRQLNLLKGEAGLK